MFRLAIARFTPVCLVCLAMVGVAACSDDLADGGETPKSPPVSDAVATFTEEERLDLVADTAVVERGRRLFSNCAVCHSVDASVTSPAGPHLGNVLGREVASVDEYPYTIALRAIDGVWTLERVDQFIANPMATYPGTSMAFGGVADPDNRLAIIAYLASISTN